MNILVTFDQTFLQHAVVMIRSLVYNHTDLAFTIYVYTDDVSKTDSKLSREFANDHVKFKYIDFDHSKYPPLKTKFHYGEQYYKIIYLRLNIGEILSDLDRILLLDTDLVVDGDLSEFYNQSLADNELLAAIAEVRPSNFRKFSIEPEHRNSKTNFNCGASLIDLKKWREWGVSGQSMEHILKYEEILGAPTQDTLNPLFYNNWKICSPKYNLHHYYLLYPFQMEDLPYSQRTLKDAIENPVVIHYSGSMRPWDYLDINPLSKRYWHYLRMTTYSGYTVNDKSLKNFLLKTFRKLKVASSRRNLEKKLFAQ